MREVLGVINEPALSVLGVFITLMSMAAALIIARITRFL